MGASREGTYTDSQVIVEISSRSNNNALPRISRAEELRQGKEEKKNCALTPRDPYCEWERTIGGRVRKKIDQVVGGDPTPSSPPQASPSSTKNSQVSDQANPNPSSPSKPSPPSPSRTPPRSTRRSHPESKDHGPQESPEILAARKNLILISKASIGSNKFPPEIPFAAQVAQFQKQYNIPVEIPGELNQATLEELQVRADFIKIERGLLQIWRKGVRLEKPTQDRLKMLLETALETKAPSIALEDLVKTYQTREFPNRAPDGKLGLLTFRELSLDYEKKRVEGNQPFPPHPVTLSEEKFLALKKQIASHTVTVQAASIGKTILSDPQRASEAIASLIRDAKVSRPSDRSSAMYGIFEVKSFSDGTFEIRDSQRNRSYFYDSSHEPQRESDFSKPQDQQFQIIQSQNIKDAYQFLHVVLGIRSRQKK